MAKVNISPKLREYLLRISNGKKLEFSNSYGQGFFYRGELHIVKGHWVDDPKDTLIFEVLQKEM